MTEKEDRFSDYSLDINAIIDFCKETVPQNFNKRTKDFRQSEITNSYELLDDSDDLALTQKVVHEVITPQDSVQYDELKTDIVKALLAKFLSIDASTGNNKDSVDISGFVVMQTLVDYDFLIKTKEEDGKEGHKEND